MELSKREFEILDVLDRQVITTQRQLSEHAGISLGQVNYVLKNLLGKGLVKLGNFRKKPRKISYSYLLTPKGIEAKSKVAVKFVLDKLKEYQGLRNRLTERLAGFETKGYCRIIFVGPEMAKDFLESIIREKNPKLILVGWCRHREELKRYKPETFDVALLFDGKNANPQKTTPVIGIPRHKVLPFW